MKDFPFAQTGTCVLFAAICHAVSAVSSSAFFRNFLDNDALPTMGGIFAVSVSVAIALISFISVITRETGAKFESSSEELRSSLMFLFFIGAAYFLFSCLSAPPIPFAPSWDYVYVAAIDVIRASLFFLFVYSLTDLIKALLLVRNLPHPPSNKGQ